MASKTTAQLKSEKNSNINTNAINSITGAIVNAFLENLLDSIANRTTDATMFGLFDYDTGRNYVIGQGVIYSNNLYVCTTNTTGIWNSAHWLQLTFGQIDVRRDIVAVTKGGTDVNFSSDLGSAGTDYVINPFCYDTEGNTIVCKIPASERDKTGFKVYPAKSGTLDYSAILI